MRADSVEKKCSPDLQRERENCPFNKEEITYIIDDGKEKTLLRRNLEEYFLSDPEFIDALPSEYLSHEEKYANDLRKAVAVVHKINNDESVQQMAGQMEGIRALMGSAIGSSLTKDGNPLTIHYVMFIPAIMGHGTPEQQGLLLGRAWAGEIIGTYAQTELGHGTFLRGLETTATYDEKTDEFILHSPTISSYKWWPGGLGKTANYAIVMAQLYTKGKCHGPHLFIVQLRHEETHKSLPGISIGEIGPKLGLNTNDNGYMGFNNHRIPRMNMLMKNAQVLKNGTYIQPLSEKLSYGTMIFVRVAICHGAVNSLMKAVTIATRYSAVRRQSLLVPGEPEPQILDYQTQQYKLLPHIATVFALSFSAKFAWKAYNECSGDVHLGNLERLPEMHALSCGLKAQSSTDSANAIDECRLACGGHGYMASSNLPRIWTAVTAAQTYEGENTVLWLQVARYIMKSVGQPRISNESSLCYLNDRAKVTSTDLSNQGLLSKWQLAAAYVIEETDKRLKSLTNAGMVYEHAWNSCSVALVKCAQIHTRYVTCDQYVRSVTDLSDISHGTRVLLQRLCRLYLLYHLLKNQGDFLRSGAITGAQLTSAEDELYGLLALLRPMSVSIVDAFDIHDRVLNSTLGSYDGRVYERLYEEALKSPLNQTDVPAAVHKYLKPLMQSKL